VLWYKRKPSEGAENIDMKITDLKQEAQLSTWDPRDALCQLKCCPTVVRLPQTDRVYQPQEHFQQLPLYSANCTVWYTYRCQRLNYRTASMQYRACHP